MKKIFIAGTFDLFHIGHQWLLWSAIRFGKKMTVIVARDETVNRIKKKMPVWNEYKRVERIKTEALPHTNVVLGSTQADFVSTLKKHNPDMVVCGYDQFLPMSVISFCQQEKIVIKRLKPYFPEFFKSSKFR